MNGGFASDPAQGSTPQEEVPLLWSLLAHSVRVAIHLALLSELPVMRPLCELRMLARCSLSPRAHQEFPS